MCFRRLGIVAVLVATFLASPALAQPCADILTEAPTDAQHEAPLMWISQRAFMGQLEAGCGDQEELLTWKRRQIRPIGRCSVAAEESATGRGPVTNEWGKNSEVVLVGVVTETETGMGGFGGHVATLVRARTTEVIADSSSRDQPWTTFSFLVFGGHLTIDGNSYCSVTPSWDFQWRAGDTVVVSGIAGFASDPNLVGRYGMPLKVVDGRAFPPESWSPNGGSLSLAEIRAAFGGQPGWFRLP